MNICFFIGIICTDVEFKFVLNGKNDSIVIKVKRKEEEKNNRVINTLVDVNNNKISTNSNSKNSDSVTGIIILGAIGGISYWRYRKYKNDKKK